MKESVNSQYLKVYGIVDMMCLHIRYNEDDSIEEQLNELFLEENTVIEARKTKKGKRKNASDSGKKRSKAKHHNTHDIEDTDDTDNDNYEFEEG